MEASSLARPQPPSAGAGGEASMPVPAHAVVNIEGKSFVLNEEQAKVRMHVALGKNAFVTGPGGTGKSMLIRVLASDLKIRNKSCVVAATTGAAAVQLNCNATTLHSFLACGLANGPIDKLLTSIQRRRSKKVEMKALQVLIFRLE
jgi:ATP-dependent DNA helicase PIF1